MLGQNLEFRDQRAFRCTFVFKFFCVKHLLRNLILDGDVLV